MDPMDDPELSLEVPLRPIFDELCCPICFSALDECTMTPCGHAFCAKCISECLNRKHSCPCCNRETVQADLIRSHQMDRIISVVQQEKKVAWDRYVEKLLHKGPDAGSLTDSQKAEKAEVLSPVELVFHKHMKRSLLSYEDYYKDLSSKCEASCAAIRAEFGAQLEERASKYAKDKKKLEKGELPGKTAESVRSRYKRKVKELKDQCQAEQEVMQSSFQTSVDLLIQQYEVYMEGFMPAREFLPVVVNVVFDGREEELVIRNLPLTRTDSVMELKEKVERRLAEMGNPLFSWDEDAIFVLRLPFGGAADDAGVQSSRFREEIMIMDELRPIVQYDAIQGSDIVIKGKTLLKADKPKICFTATYKTGDSMDYYRCEDCKINWVCKECVSGCHSGHKVSEYIMNHKPTWNCCYCVKRKKCQITNKKKRET